MDRNATLLFLVSFFFFAVLQISSCGAGDTNRATRSSSSPVVPKQTAVQAEQWAHFAALAENASIEATPAVLDYLSSPEFRSAISDLPFYNQSSEDILSLIGSVLVGSSITHNIPASNDNAFSLDVDVETLFNLNFVPNIWEMLALGFVHITNSTSYELGILDLIDNAEQKLFGLPPFQGEGNSRFYDMTLNEAQNRAGYGALNIWQLADGVEFFGPVTLMLDPAYLQSIAILSPADTGEFSSCCLEGSSAPACSIFNSTCTPLSFGTFEHYNHLILATIHESYWNYTLPELLHRVFAEPQTNLTLLNTAFYWEVDVLGNIIFPYGVSYVVVDFPSLFGSEVGLEIQNWCQQLNWALVWSIGFYNVSSQPTLSQLVSTASVSQAIIDPTTANLLLNVSASSNITAMFWEQWKLANLTREAIIEHVLPSNTTAEEVWNQVWNDTYSMIPESFHLHRPPSFISKCYSSPTPCIGMDDDGNCICYATG